MLQGFAKHGEYVDFGESWLVFLVQQQGKKILVDGQEVIIGYNGKQIFIAPNSNVQEMTPSTKTHTHWEHKETSEVMSKEEYINICNQYFNHDNYEYPSLEAEFEHRKQMQHLKDNYTPVYEETPSVFVNIPLTCVGNATPSGNKFIETALAYGKAKFSGAGFYRVNWSGLTANVLETFVNKNSLCDVFSNSNHSNVRFAKIKGNYILNEKVKGADKEKYGIYGNLELAKKDVDAHVEWLNNYLRAKVFGGNIILRKASLSKVIGDLENIMKCLDDIEPMKKSLRSKNVLIKKINELVEGYSSLHDKTID